MHTHHAQARAQQRGIPPLVDELWSAMVMSNTTDMEPWSSIWTSGRSEPCSETWARGPSRAWPNGWTPTRFARWMAKPSLSVTARAVFGGSDHDDATP